MCGIFGYLSTTAGDTFNPRYLDAIAVDTERRGPHAFGFAWIDDRNRLHHYKQTGRISDALSTLAMARGARAIIAHTRYATHGDFQNQLNNHPHACDGGFIVHNGVVHNHRTLNEIYRLRCMSECDSETIARLIEHHDGSLLDRVTHTMSHLTSPAVVCGLWPRPARLIIARSGNPLSISTTKGGIYFASYPDALPGKPAEFPDRRVQAFRAA